MEREIKYGRLVVDEAFTCDFGKCFRVKNEMYKIIGIGSMTAPEDKELKKIAYIPEAAIPFIGYEYAMHGLYPRDGYEKLLIPFGRAITEEELALLRKKHHIDDDNITKPFPDTYRGCFGAPEEYHKQYTAIQVRVEAYDAIPLEHELTEKGIHAYNGSAGRVTIRIA